MNLLIISNTESTSYSMLRYCLLKTPKNVNWKILGNVKYHQKLISIFGIDKFIDIPIFPLHHHTQESNIQFDFLKDIPEHSIIIPSDFESLRFLTRNKHAFPGHTVCPLMEENVLDYLDDKSNQKQIANNCGVTSPKEYLYTQLKEMPQAQRVVIKVNLSSGSNGVFISENLQQAINYYESLSLENREKQIIQEYINGDDYFYYAICYNGKIYIRGIIKPSRLKKYHLKTEIAILVNNPSFDKIAEKIISYYKYSGPVSIDFRTSQESGEIYLIEINPRNGNNFYFFNAANINWLLEMAKISENPNTYIAPTFNINTEYVWIYSWKRALYSLFLNLKIQNVKILVPAIKIQIIPDIKMEIKKLLSSLTIPSL